LNGGVLISQNSGSQFTNIYIPGVNSTEFYADLSLNLTIPEAGNMQVIVNNSVIILPNGTLALNYTYYMNVLGSPTLLECVWWFNNNSALSTVSPWINNFELVDTYSSPNSACSISN